MSETELLSKFEYAHIQLLPEFDGTPSCSLDYFLARCDSFLSNFHRATTVPNAGLINEFLFNVVKSKLKGEARSILDIEANVSYDRFKEKLVRKYGDVKDERILLKDIANCYQKHGESYTDYYERLTSLVLRYKSLCKINYKDQVLDLKLKEIEELSLTTFRAGIFEPYRIYLRYAQIGDLSHALRVCRSYDNDRAYENYMDQLRGSQKTSQIAVNKTSNIRHSPNGFRNPISNPFMFSNVPQPLTYYRPTTGQPLTYRPTTPPPYNNQVQVTQRPNLPVPSHTHQIRNTPPSTAQWTAPTPSNLGQVDQKPAIPSSRPYPNPNNIGRRFSQTQTSFPKPMSGISTIRGNYNHHFESEENPYPDTEQTYKSTDDHDTVDYFGEQPENRDNEDNHWFFQQDPLSPQKT